LESEGTRETFVKSLRNAGGVDSKSVRVELDHARITMSLGDSDGTSLVSFEEKNLDQVDFERV